MVEGLILTMKTVLSHISKVQRSKGKCPNHKAFSRKCHFIVRVCVVLVVIAKIYYIFIAKANFQREWEAERQIIHLLLHLPNVHNAQSWSDSKPGSRSLLWVFQVGAESQKQSPFSGKQGVGWKVEQLEHEQEPIWDAGTCRRWLAFWAMGAGPNSLLFAKFIYPVSDDVNICLK